MTKVQFEVSSVPEYHRTLARRIVPGAAAHVFMLTVFLILSSEYQSWHTTAVSLGGTLLFFNLVRFAMGIAQERFYPHLSALWIRTFLTLTFATSLGWGALALFALWEAGAQSHLFVFMLLALAGIAVGGATSLAPLPHLARVFVALIFAPSFIQLLELGTRESTSLAGLILFFVAFLFAQTVVQGREHRISRQTLSHYRAIAETSGEGIAIHQNGKIVECNRTFASIVGYDASEVLGMELRRFCDPDQFAIVAQNIASGSSDIYEVTACKKDGTRFPVELCGIACEWDGRPARAARIRDLTNQKRLEESLQLAKENAEREVSKQQAQIEAILDHSPAVIFMKDQEGRYIVVNRQFESLFKISRDQVYGLRDIDFQPADAAAAVRESDLAVVNSEQPIRREETIAVHGTLKTYMTIKFPVYDVNGKMSGVCGIATDMTDHKRANDEKAALEVREKAAIETSRLKSEFLATMSHEIRTPINGIMGMSELLCSTPLNGEQREYAEAMRRSGESLLTVINDILDFSKIEAGRIEFESVEFSIEEPIYDVVRAMNFEARRKGVELVLDIESDLPATVMGDPGRLTQVLNNLVANAVKFTARGQVTVRVQRNEDVTDAVELAVDVIDTGVGIDPATVERLFHPFTQADASTSRRFGGTGLGLSIAKSLVEKMNGALGVRSRLGEGSTFWFRVRFEKVSPEHKRGGGSSDAPRPAVVHSPVQTLRVLIAEDNPVNQIIAIRMVEKLGYTAIAVANGKEALATLRAERFDLVLMDVQMPEMDGLEATRTIRSDATLAGIPVVALTANAIKGDSELCLASGMNDYLSKPVTAERLGAMVNKWIGSQSGTRPTAALRRAE